MGIGSFFKKAGKDIGHATEDVAKGTVEAAAAGATIVAETAPEPVIVEQPAPIEVIEQVPVLEPPVSVYAPYRALPPHPAFEPHPPLEHLPPR